MSKLRDCCGRYTLQQGTYVVGVVMMVASFGLLIAMSIWAEQTSNELKELEAETNKTRKIIHAKLKFPGTAHNSTMIVNNTDDSSVNSTPTKSQLSVMQGKKVDTICSAILAGLYGLALLLSAMLIYGTPRESQCILRAWYRSIGILSLAVGAVCVVDMRNSIKHGNTHRIVFGVFHIIFNIVVGGYLCLVVRSYAQQLKERAARSAEEAAQLRPVAP